MAKTVELKPEEAFARSYVDRLILEKLTEMESAVKLGELADLLSSSGIGLATVRSLLASNPERFAYHERKWIPAARLASQGRPFNEAIRLIIDTFGGPMPIDLLAMEIARARHEEADDVRPRVERVVETDKQFAVGPDGRVALVRWGFVASAESRERAFALNEVSADEVAAVRAKLGDDFNWRQENAFTEAVKKTAPVSLKALGAAAWSTLNPEDPRSIHLYDAKEFYSQVTTMDGFVLTPNGMIYPEAEVKKWVAVATRLADKLAPTVEMEDAAPIEIKPEDTKRMADKIAGAGETVTATKLLEENYEITPGTKTFPDDMANLMDALRGDSRIQWVGGDRFRKAGDVPDFVNEVPEPFQFVQTENKDEEGELVDVELTDEGLSSTLRKLLVHPLAMDVLDEDPMPAQKATPETMRLVLKSIHRELGTFPLAQFPQGWFTDTPALQESILIDPTGRELQVWINHEARLIYNFFDWWFEQPVESGAVFTLTKTPRANVYDFAWMDQPDPVVYISTQRMEELRNLGAESEGKSTLDLLIETMAHWPKGADYLTILAELNVARRVSRRLVASLLSSYVCFYQRSGSPVWHFDAKKVEQGFDKTKRKFIKK